MSHVLARLNDDSRALVAQSKVLGYNAVADVAVFPEMYIAAADTCCADMDEAFVGFDGRDVGVEDVELVGGVCRYGDVGRFAGEDFRC